MDLKNIFEKFSGKSKIFRNREALQARYHPEKILHRDKELEKIAAILAPSLKGEKPSNLFIYGKTGTGKTLCVLHVAKQLEEFARERKGNVRIIYVNCKLKRVADTPYRLLAHILHELGQEVPSTGLPTDELYKAFYDLIDRRSDVIILILDEIDQLVAKSGDDILYNLSRIDSELKNARLSIVGISNDLLFAENLDPRVKSSLSEEEVVFPPYNALQIKDILEERARIAFQQGVIGEGVIQKIAAISARSHGDARRALELLRITGELAERKDMNKLTLELVDEAEEKMESENIIETIKAQPQQYKAVLYTAITLNEKNMEINTGELYNHYRRLCSQIKVRPLTQRRVSDIIAELDMQGLLSAKTINRGRYGRTKSIECTIPLRLLEHVKKILREDLGL